MSLRPTSGPSSGGTLPPQIEINKKQDVEKSKESPSSDDSIKTSQKREKTDSYNEVSSNSNSSKVGYEPKPTNQSGSLERATPRQPTAQIPKELRPKGTWKNVQDLSMQNSPGFQSVRHEMGDTSVTVMTGVSAKVNKTGAKDGTLEENKNGFYIEFAGNHGVENTRWLQFISRNASLKLNNGLEVPLPIVDRQGGYEYQLQQGPPDRKNLRVDSDDKRDPFYDAGSGNSVRSKGLTGIYDNPGDRSGILRPFFHLSSQTKQVREDAQRDALKNVDPQFMKIFSDPDVGKQLWKLASGDQQARGEARESLRQAGFSREFVEAIRLPSVPPDTKLQDLPIGVDTATMRANFDTRMVQFPDKKTGKLESPVQVNIAMEGTYTADDLKNQIDKRQYAVQVSQPQEPKLPPELKQTLEEQYPHLGGLHR